MNREITKFNSLYDQTVVLSGENNEDLLTRVQIMYKENERNREFSYKSAWRFCETYSNGKNLDSTQARRSLGRPDVEPDLFGDDPIPRPFGAPRTYDRATKLERIERETAARLEVSYAQKRNEDLNMFALDTTGMNSADTAKIE
ncbi:hypothetical protein Tco_1099975 [Tanacetum coccineum]